MTFHELIIQSIDSEITQHELEKEQCLEPVYSDKHRRIIKKAKRIAESNLNGSSKRMRRIHKRYILIAALISILLMAMIISSIAERKPGYSMNIELSLSPINGVIPLQATAQRNFTATKKRTFLTILMRKIQKLGSITTSRKFPKTHLSDSIAKMII